MGSSTSLVGVGYYDSIARRVVLVKEALRNDRVEYSCVEITCFVKVLNHRHGHVPPI